MLGRFDPRRCFLLFSAKKMARTKQTARKEGQGTPRRVETWTEACHASKRVRTDSGEGSRSGGDGKAASQLSIASSNPDVVTSLECPVCLLTAFPPVRQCPNGHTLCDGCSVKSACQVCPICRAQPTSIRCLAIEKVAQSLAWPCRFEKFGCAEQLKFDAATAHFSVCKHREQACCPWQHEGDCEDMMVLDKESIVHHLTTRHRIDFKELKDIGTEAGYYHAFSVDYDPGSNHYGMDEVENIIMLKHLDTHLMLTFGSTSQTYYLLVTAIGRKDEACGLEYKVWCNGNTIGNGRKFQFSGPVVSHEEYFAHKQSYLDGDIDDDVNDGFHIRKSVAWRRVIGMAEVNEKGWLGFNVSITRSS